MESWTKGKEEISDVGMTFIATSCCLGELTPFGLQTVYMPSIMTSLTLVPCGNEVYSLVRVYKRHNKAKCHRFDGMANCCLNGRYLFL